MMKKLRNIKNVFRPRYKRLVRGALPRNSVDGLNPVPMEKLYYYSLLYPEKMEQVGEYLNDRAMKLLRRGRVGHVALVMDALAQLLRTAPPLQREVLVEPFMSTALLCLQSHVPRLQVTATYAFIHFVILKDETLYHQNYEKLLLEFAAMCHYTHGNLAVQEEVRHAGIQGLEALLMWCDELLDDIYSPAYMSIILPSLLFNFNDPEYLAMTTIERKDHSMTPPGIAESCLREYVARTSPSRVHFVITPVLRYLDEHGLWSDEQLPFELFKVVMLSVEAPYAFYLIERLVEHSSPRTTPDTHTRARVLEVVIVITEGATDEAVGPAAFYSVGKLLQDLVIAVNYFHGVDENNSSNVERYYQDTLVRALEAIAMTLPDYYKLEMIVFVIQSVPIPAHDMRDVWLRYLLLDIVDEVSQQYCTIHLTTALPAQLLRPLLELSLSPNPRVRLSVHRLLQNLIDRNGNAERLSEPWTIALATDVHRGQPTPLDAAFMRRFGLEIFHALYEGFAIFNNSRRNVRAVFTTAALIIVEAIAEATMIEALRFIINVQELVEQSPDLSARWRGELLACESTLARLLALVAPCAQLPLAALDDRLASPSPTTSPGTALSTTPVYSAHDERFSGRSSEPKPTPTLIPTLVVTPAFTTTLVPSSPPDIRTVSFRQTPPATSPTSAPSTPPELCRSPVSSPSPITTPEISVKPTTATKALMTSLVSESSDALNSPPVSNAATGTSTRTTVTTSTMTTPPRTFPGCQPATVPPRRCHSTVPKATTTVTTLHCTTPSTPPRIIQSTAGAHSPAITHATTPKTTPSTPPSSRTSTTSPGQTPMVPSAATLKPAPTGSPTPASNPTPSSVKVRCCSRSAPPSPHEPHAFMMAPSSVPVSPMEATPPRRVLGQGRLGPSWSPVVRALLRRRRVMEALRNDGWLGVTQRHIAPYSVEVHQCPSPSQKMSVSDNRPAQAHIAPVPVSYNIQQAEAGILSGSDKSGDVATAKEGSQNSPDHKREGKKIYPAWGGLGPMQWERRYVTTVMLMTSVTPDSPLHTRPSSTVPGASGTSVLPSVMSSGFTSPTGSPGHSRIASAGPSSTGLLRRSFSIRSHQSGMLTLRESSHGRLVPPRAPRTLESEERWDFLTTVLLLDERQPQPPEGASRSSTNLLVGFGAATGSQHSITSSTSSVTTTTVSESPLASQSHVSRGSECHASQDIPKEICKSPVSADRSSLSRRSSKASRVSPLRPKLVLMRSSKSPDDKKGKDKQQLRMTRSMDNIDSDIDSSGDEEDEVEEDEVEEDEEEEEDGEGEKGESARRGSSTPRRSASQRHPRSSDSGSSGRQRSSIFSTGVASDRRRIPISLRASRSSGDSSGTRRSDDAARRGSDVKSRSAMKHAPSRTGAMVRSAEWSRGDVDARERSGHDRHRGRRSLRRQTVDAAAGTRTAPSMSRTWAWQRSWAEGVRHRTGRRSSEAGGAARTASRGTSPRTGVGIDEGTGTSTDVGTGTGTETVDAETSTGAAGATTSGRTTRACTGSGLAGAGTAAGTGAGTDAAVGESSGGAGDRHTATHPDIRAQRSSSPYGQFNSWSPSLSRNRTSLLDTIAMRMRTEAAVASTEARFQFAAEQERLNHRFTLHPFSDLHPPPSPLVRQQREEGNEGGGLRELLKRQLAYVPRPRPRMHFVHLPLRPTLRHFVFEGSYSLEDDEDNSRPQDDEYAFNEEAEVPQLVESRFKSMLATDIPPFATPLAVLDVGSSGHSYSAAGRRSPVKSASALELKEQESQPMDDEDQSKKREDRASLPSDESPTHTEQLKKTLTFAVPDKYKVPDEVAPQIDTSETRASETTAGTSLVSDAYVAPQKPHSPAQENPQPGTAPQKKYTCATQPCATLSKHVQTNVGPESPNTEDGNIYTRNIVQQLSHTHDSHTFVPKIVPQNSHTHDGGFTKLDLVAMKQSTEHICKSNVVPQKRRTKATQTFRPIDLLEKSRTIDGQVTKRNISTCPCSRRNPEQKPSTSFLQLSQPSAVLPKSVTDDGQSSEPRIDVQNSFSTDEKVSKPNKVPQKTRTCSDPICKLKPTSLEQYTSAGKIFETNIVLEEAHTSAVKVTESNVAQQPSPTYSGLTGKQQSGLRTSEENVKKRIGNIFGEMRKENIAEFSVTPPVSSTQFVENEDSEHFEISCSEVHSGHPKTCSCSIPYKFEKRPDGIENKSLGITEYKEEGFVGTHDDDINACIGSSKPKGKPTHCISNKPRHCNKITLELPIPVTKKTVEIEVDIDVLQKNISEENVATTTMTIDEKLNENPQYVFNNNKVTQTSERTIRSGPISANITSSSACSTTLSETDTFFSEPTTDSESSKLSGLDAHITYCTSQQAGETKEVTKDTHSCRPARRGKRCEACGKPRDPKEERKWHVKY